MSCSDRSNSTDQHMSPVDLPIDPRKGTHCSRNPYPVYNFITYIFVNLLPIWLLCLLFLHFYL